MDRSRVWGGGGGKGGLQVSGCGGRGRCDCHYKELVEGLGEACRHPGT